MSYFRYPKYVSVGEKRAKAEKKLKQLQKKNPGIQPIIIDSRALANTWWGKAWNKNLERYADYENRIGRGRSYVRHRAVLDLKIKPGKVEALVQGSRSKPYSVKINMKPIPKKNWTAIKKACKGQLDSMRKLIGGTFPKALSTIFTKEKTGLFPSPKEIDFNCSCPDWAFMCKHVAAALYGVAARLDEDPSLFFVLRKADVNDLVSETVKESKKDLLLKAKKKTGRVIENDAGLAEMFGIDLGDGHSPQKPATKKTLPGRKKKKPAPIKPTVSKHTPKSSKSRKKATASGRIANIIRRRKKGFPVSELIEKSGMEAQKVRNIVFRLKRMGKIENVARGVYRWVE